MLRRWWSGDGHLEEAINSDQTSPGQKPLGNSWSALSFIPKKKKTLQLEHQTEAKSLCANRQEKSKSPKLKETPCEPCCQLERKRNPALSCLCNHSLNMHFDRTHSIFLSVLKMSMKTEGKNHT